MAKVSDFPWERFSAAQEYLYAIKPWWRKFGGRIQWIPVSSPPPPGMRYVASSFVGKSGLSIYVDASFASSAPIHIISGQIEHDLQVLVRKVNARLTHVPESRSRQRNVAFELEINSAIQSENESNKFDRPIDPMYLSRLLKDSYSFNQKDMEKWNINAWPGLSDSAILPSKIGLPNNLSAEEYFRMLDRVIKVSREESGSEFMDISDSGEQYQTEEDEFVSESDAQPSNESGGNGDESANNSQQQSADQNPEDFTSPSSDDFSEQAQALEDSKTLMDQVNEMSNSDPLMDWSASDHENMEEAFSDDSHEEPNEYEMNDILQDVADEIMDEDSAPGFGSKPGNATMNWAEVNFKKKSSSWERIFRGSLVANVNSSISEGSSDFSYSAINHNQPKFGPRLMGAYDYSPTLYIILDVSASMLHGMDRAMTALRDITAEVASSYGLKVTWITIDTKVRSVGNAMRIDSDILKRIGRGGGLGETDLKFVIMDVAAGKFEWEGKRYSAPDILVVISDCFFLWPWVTKKPKGRTRLIVGSIIPYQRIVGRKGRVDFPQWVKPNKRNFVYISK